jgi:kynurenine 3-monooxygenase
MSTKRSITIIGSGLAGSFLAVMLAKKGHKVAIYERLSKKDIFQTASQRSINIVLFGYAISLLKKAKLWEALKPHLLTLQGTVTHVANTEKPIVSYIDQNKMPYYTITRSLLASIFLDQALSHPAIKVHFDTALVSINRHDRTLVIQNAKTNTITTVLSDVVIGADGANSLVRTFIQQGQENHHIQEFASWQYKQFLLTTSMVKILNLQNNFVHTWTQKNAFITVHQKKEEKNQELAELYDIKTFFTNNFPDFQPVLEDISKQFMQNPVGNFATIHTDPWYYKDYMAIIGDAAHGFYPFFGQGTTAAFEDCMTIMELIEKYADDWNKIFQLYQEKRKIHTDALGELSKEVLNKYLRHKKADFDAVYDKLELKAYQAFPTIINKPLSMAIITDPANAADYRNSHLKRKKIAKSIGISSFIAFTVILLGLYEKFTERNKEN